MIYIQGIRLSVFKQLQRSNYPRAPQFDYVLPQSSLYKSGKRKGKAPELLTGIPLEGDWLERLLQIISQSQP